MVFGPHDHSVQGDGRNGGTNSPDCHYLSLFSIPSEVGVTADASGNSVGPYVGTDSWLRVLTMFSEPTELRVYRSRLLLSPGLRFGCSQPGPDSAVSRRLGRACCAVPRSEPQVSRSLPPCLRQFRCAGRCGLVLGQLPPMDNGQICRLVFQPDAQPLSVEPGTPLAPRRQPGDAAPPAFAGGCRERPVRRRRRPSPRRGGPAPLRPASHAPLRPLGPSSGSSGPSARR